MENIENEASDIGAVPETPPQAPNLPSIGLIDRRHDLIGSDLAGRVAAMLGAPVELKDYQVSSCQYGTNQSTESATFKINDTTKITVRLQVTP